MSVARHTSYNLIGALLPVAVSLVTIPLYLSAIGLERYGVLSICWLLLGYFGLFELGLGLATARSLASFAPRSHVERNELLWNALFLSLILGLLGAAILVLIGKQVLLLLRDLGELTSEIDKSMVWLALCVPATTIYGVLNGALQGRQQFLAMNVASSISNVLMAVLPLLAAYYFSPQLPSLIAAVLVARIVSTLLLAAASIRIVPIGAAVKPSGAIMKSLVAFGGWLTGNGIVSPILNSIEKYILGLRVGAAAVGTYVVPFNLVSRYVLLPQSLSSALLPRFASTRAEEAAELEYGAVRALASTAAPLTILALAILPWFLRLWIGAVLAERMAPIAAIILVGYWFNGFAQISYTRLQAAARPDLVTKISLYQLLPYLIVIYWAVTQGGAIGAALTWSARVAIEMFIFFVATGQSARLLRSIAVPAALITTAAVVSMSRPSYLGWIIEAALIAAAVAFGYRELAGKLAELFPTTFGRWAGSPARSASE